MRLMLERRGVANQLHVGGRSSSQLLQVRAPDHVHAELAAGGAAGQHVCRVKPLHLLCRELAELLHLLASSCARVAGG